MVSFVIALFENSTAGTFSSQCRRTLFYMLKMQLNLFTVEFRAVPYPPAAMRIIPTCDANFFALPKNFSALSDTNFNGTFLRIFKI